jgi:hypothetical protein
MLGEAETTGRLGLFIEGLSDVTELLILGDSTLGLVETTLWLPTIIELVSGIIFNGLPKVSDGTVIGLFDTTETAEPLEVIPTNGLCEAANIPESRIFTIGIDVLALSISASDDGLYLQAY